MLLMQTFIFQVLFVDGPVQFILSYLKVFSVLASIGGSETWKRLQILMPR